MKSCGQGDGLPASGLGVSLLEHQRNLWRAVEGTEFRNVTVVASKGKDGPCWDQKHVAVYRGHASKWKMMTDTF